MAAHDRVLLWFQAWAEPLAGEAGVEVLGRKSGVRHGADFHLYVVGLRFSAYRGG